jgi:NAD(P)-dependent dehydrogenase (short-subunit alcohol dehydrogenase family)
MSLEGKVALVTGAARRVGRTIALAFAAKGVRVAVHYRTAAPEARRVADAVRSLSGADAEVFRADLADPRAPDKLADAVARRFGRIDILINSASIYEKTPFALATPDDWDRHMAVNARAPFFLAQACAPWLRRTGEGIVINVADWAGRRPYADYAPYCASKAALLSVNAALAKALAPEIRVNAVLPGPVLPPERMSDAEKKKIADATLLKRLGTPEAVARACLYLAHAADYTTGAELTVDGGRLIV